MCEFIDWLVRQYAEDSDYKESGIKEGRKEWGGGEVKIKNIFCKGKNLKTILFHIFHHNNCESTLYYFVFCFCFNVRSPGIDHTFPSYLSLFS